jgi:hypothetical protein
MVVDAIGDDLGAVGKHRFIAAMQTPECLGCSETWGNKPKEGSKDYQSYCATGQR